MVSTKDAPCSIERTAAGKHATEYAYEGFTIVTAVSNKNEIIPEDEKLALVGAYHSYQAVLDKGVDVEQYATDKEDFLIVEIKDADPSDLDAVAVAEYKALDRPTVISECARTLLQHLPEGQTLDLHEIYKTMVSALQTLFNCADEWDSRKGKTVENTAKHVMRCIRSLPRFSQVALHQLLQILFRTSDWMALDEKLVIDEHYDVSAVMWLLMVGPHGLLVGWARGLSARDIALTHENHQVNSMSWTEEHRAVLQDFAADLRFWGRAISDTLKEQTTATTNGGV